MRQRTFLISTVAVLALAALAIYFLRTPLSLALLQRVALERISADALSDLPDGLHLGLCGSGSPFPDEKRAGPCTLVVAGKRLFVFDAGSGSSRNIGRMGFNQGRIEAIFLTHFHSDHIDGLGELMLQRWVAGANATPLPVYGPPGVESVVDGLRQAYAQDQRYRVAHHGEATVPASGFGGNSKPLAVGADARVVVLKDADLEIAAFAVDHAPVHPAIGYRISYKGRSLVLSGDTRKSPAVLRAAAGVDLLVHEALAEPLVRLLQDAAVRAGKPKLGKIFGDIVDYHSTPEQAAEVARDAGVRYLLLNHIVPALPLPGMESIFLGRAGDIYQGTLRLGTDGDFVSLPAGSTEIQASRRF